MVTSSKANIGQKMGRGKKTTIDHKMALVIDKSGSRATGHQADFGKIFGGVGGKKRSGNDEWVLRRLFCRADCI